MKQKPIILVVDDQPQNIDLLEAYLVTQDYEIRKADNGYKALEILSDSQIDLVLLDVMMPGMNGGRRSRASRRQGHRGRTLRVGDCRGVRRAQVPRRTLAAPNP